MKRLFDLTLALILLLVTAPLMALVALAVRLTSPGPALYVSDRVGKGGCLFSMYKFRSMRSDTPAVATHLLTDASSRLTPIGAFIRKSSLDELPQLLNIIKGEMSFVGPRPALYNQDDLMELRREAGVDRLTPGVTGWAQINGRDDLSVEEKVRWEKEYLDRRSFGFDLYILGLTFIHILRPEGVSH